MSDRRLSRSIFMAKYGSADDITRMIHSRQYTDHEMMGIMNNPQFNKRHLAAMFDTVVPNNHHAPHNPLMVTLAQHPMTNVHQLRKLVDPHRGYPFQGSPPNRWPQHAQIAKKRLDLNDEDDE